VQWLAVGLFAVLFAVVVVFGDPVGQVYAYPLIALAAVAGFAVVVRRGVAPVVFAVAFVLAMLPTAGVADRLGRDGDAVAYGACTAPVAAFFVDPTGPQPVIFYAPPPSSSVTSETKLIPQTIVRGTATDPEPMTCDRLAGQRLATSLAMVLVGVLLLLTTSRGPATDFRVRGPR